MTVFELLAELRSRNVRLWADGDRLRVGGARGSLTPDLREQLARNKAEILDLLQSSHAGDDVCAPIVAVDRQAEVPLSFAQQRLWFLEQLEPGNPTYHMGSALWLDGDLNVAVLRRSLEEIVRRHESLRTRFVASEGSPFQIIAPALRLSWGFEDLRNLGPDDCRAEVDRIADREARLPFDLERGPLVRFRLLRLDDDKHVFLYTLHHIIADAWSRGLLRREITILYGGFLAGRTPELPCLPVQYPDYAVWQRERLGGPRLERLLEYWKEQLADLPVLQLPTDRPRPAVLSSNGAHFDFSLPSSLADAAESVCRAEGVTLAMFMLAAYQVLLCRYSGQDDIAVGSPIANRPRPELEDLIGFFANTLVLRTKLDGNPTFREFLRRVRRLSLEAYEKQEVPFQTLVEVLRPERDPRRSPLFQAVFAMQNAPGPGLALGNVVVSSARTTLSVARADVELHCTQRPTCIRCRLIYNTDLFNAATTERMAGHYRRLLESLLADPETCIRDASLITDAERQTVLIDWNSTAQPYPTDACIHQLVETQVDEAPGAVALIHRDRSMTYEELDERANQLAHALRGRGVRPDTLVGLCVERSPEMVVGLLGILKAGGAYVPLDSGYPARRVAFMLADSGAKVLVTQAGLLDALPPHEAEVLCLDRDWPAIAAMPATRPPQTATPDHLAYVIYTSGSTGQPKGVLVEHRGLSNLAHAQIEALRIRTDSRILQFASLSFDASVWEIFPALAAGAAIVLADQEALLPGTGLIEFLRACEVTTVTLPPSVLRALPPPTPALPKLETIVSAGEACSADLVRQWGRTARFINAYGPTEATVCATLSECDPSADRSPSIGRPMANVRVYLLDRALQPTPVGVAGELYVGGRGVARGYLNRPELTAERFVPNPFGRAGDRLYRTGDLARFREDGKIEYVGRVDHQVKFRGFRIEPGEIEAALREHDDVEDVVVVGREIESVKEKDVRLVAYVATRSGDPLPSKELRQCLRDRVPYYMIPSHFVTLAEIPLTPNGKIDRAALPAPDRGPSGEAAFVPPRSELERRIAGIWSELLGTDRVGLRDNFFDLGGHSLALVQLHQRLIDELGCELAVIELFEFPTIEALAGRIGDDERPGAKLLDAARARTARGVNTGENAIAVIGITGRFPGAPDTETLWENLCAGVESIRFFTDDELREAGVPETTIRHPDYVKARGVIEGADLFDAWFFGYNPREAELIDPQQRVFLECAHEALERAGYDPERYIGVIGVYAGAGQNAYLRNILSRPDLLSAAGAMQVVISNDKDFLPTRVSYKLNLHGPSVNVQSACSTSLVAVHEACRSLLDHRCDIALAGGVTVGVSQMNGYLYAKGGIHSPDGHCRTFDAKALGTVGGNGAGVVVLKRLDEAREDGDEIHAVILGTATSNDGSRKVGYTAPSVEGQAEAIALAHAAGDVDPDTITYVEAHGTGTTLGDPIEIAALQRVFGERSARRQFCAIGALKSNLGHLDTAAGVAGLIKTVLALEHRQIPPSLHYETPNPEIDFASTAFFVNTTLRPWTTEDGMPRRAGVSSFGIGGTNAHAVLEEAPALEPSGPSRPCQLLLLSAKTEGALRAMTRNLASHLCDRPDANLADVAHTLQVGRREFQYRRAVACESVTEAVEVLEGNRPAQRCSRRAASGPCRVAFLFPGQGSQYANMGLGLYRSEHVFRETVDNCLEEIAPHLTFDLRSVLYPEGEVDLEAATARLTRTEVAQPALFIVEYALAQLWRSWGVEPDAMIGHSIGEYVSACLAGVLPLPDAMRLVALRGRLMEAMPPGVMLTVPLAETRIKDLLDGAEDLWLSAVNGPSMCVVSGTPASAERLERTLMSSGVECRRLHTSHAFHSGLMDGAVCPFSEAVREVAIGSPEIPYASNVTGRWISQSDAEDPSYWGRHIREAVRFGDGLEMLLGDANRVLLEVGPGQVLGTLARQHPSWSPTRVVMSSLRHPRASDDDAAVLTAALGQLWTGGVSIDWLRYRSGEKRRRVTLPTYPFDRERFWIDPPRRGAVARKLADLADWFYVPLWRRTAGIAAGVCPAPGRCLVFADDSPLACDLIARLETVGRAVTVVEAGSAFECVTADRFAIDPATPEHYEKLLAELRSTDRTPEDIVHLWGLGDAPERLDHRQRGFDSLLFLGRALGGGAAPVRITIVTGGVRAVTGADPIEPEKALVLGPALVLGCELPHLTCRHIDLEARARTDETTATAACLANEVGRHTTEPVIAYRDGERYVQAFVSARLEAVECVPARLRSEGVYLITGGLGHIGSVFAEFLAREVSAKLMLVGRTSLPERADWAEHLERHGEDDAISQKIRAVEAIEDAGGEVTVIAADVTDLEQMRTMVAQMQEHFGAIDGVIHAVGVVGEGVMLLKDRAEAWRAMAPKVDGARVLGQLFADAQLDFMVLCSSLATVQGIPGQVDSTAANAYLDAFARRFAADTGTFSIAINWDRAIFEGSYELGGELLGRVFAHAVDPQIVVSEFDFRDVMGAERGVARDTIGDVPLAPRPTHARPGLSTEFVAPHTETERALTKIWETLLGIEGIGVHDSFFELGGHSLVATQLTTRIRSTLGAEVLLRDLFAYPTVGELAERIRSAGARLATPPLVRCDRDGDLPLSFAQQRLWFLEQMDVGAAYNIPMARRLRGRLDVERLDQAFQEVVRRHEALRTSFPVVDGQPVQRITQALGFELDRVELCVLDTEEQETEVLRLALEEAGRPFDLAVGPLLRCTLLTLGDEAHVLLLTMHHIVSDGWSMGVLFGELTALYAAFSQGEASPLGELEIQYGDFARWQRSWLVGEALDEQMSYWQEQLADMPTLDLPSDRPRPAAQTFEGAAHGFEIPSELCETLRQLSRQEGLTLAMVLLAGWQVLLSRYSGQDDVAVGTPIANRTHDALEPLIGFFVNTLVMRTDLSGDPTVKEVLRRVQEVSLSAYEHQDVPFEQVVDDLNPPRDLSRHPLFQVMFAMQNAPRAALRLGELEIDGLGLGTTTTHFDLELHCSEHGDRLVGRLIYNTDLFEVSTVERMSDHLVRLLEGMASDPSWRLSELSLLSEAERHQILVEWNDTDAAYPDEKCVHELFEEQVERTPEAVAVVFGDQALTYEQLNRRANHVAHTLRGMGVGVEDLVGLCVERSLEMVVGLLGILKAGGAYVPLDPTYPRERLAYMLEQSRVSVLLTQEPLLQALPAHQMEVLCLDRDASAIGRARSTNLASLGTAGSLAYVIYTSGSTGRPKGVEVPHGCAVNFLASMRETPGIAPDDVLVAVTTLSFDISVLELMLPLTVGARVVIASRDVASDSVLLSRELRRVGATVLQATPGAWRMLAESGWSDPGLTMLCGGEAQPRSLANELLDRGGRLWNMYGPTETTVWSAIACVTGGDRAVSIGRPIGNTRIYILDRTLRPVPIGAVGELCIGGAGVARGYRHQAALTAERLVPDPFGEASGARLYRTGDLARYRADGDIDFIGRVDDQIKLRGYRIELGEIEAVLVLHASVDQVVAQVREDRTGDRRLVAYVVASNGASLITPEVQGFLKERLPVYMVPSALVQLESLPLTPNGKVDRRALPRPEILGSAQHTPPETLLQIVLAELWKDLLGVEDVGLRDNFFELGGHSLLVIRLLNRLREALDVELPVRAVFDAPTLARLGDLISKDYSPSIENDAEELVQMIEEIRGLSDTEIEGLLDSGEADA